MTERERVEPASPRGNATRCDPGKTHFSGPVDSASKPSAWAAAQIKHGEFTPASRAQLVQCVSQNSPDFLIAIGVLPVELIKLVDIAIRVGVVAFTGAVIIQTDIGILNSGNMSNKGSHGQSFHRRSFGAGASWGRRRAC